MCAELKELEFAEVKEINLGDTVRIRGVEYTVQRFEMFFDFNGTSVRIIALDPIIAIKEKQDAETRIKALEEYRSLIPKIRTVLDDSTK